MKNKRNDEEDIISKRKLRASPLVESRCVCWFHSAPNSDGLASLSCEERGNPATLVQSSNIDFRLSGRLAAMSFGMMHVVGVMPSCLCAVSGGDVMNVIFLCGQDRWGRIKR
jgi:hypothetical protein